MHSCQFWKQYFETIYNISFVLQQACETVTIGFSRTKLDFAGKRTKRGK